MNRSLFPAGVCGGEFNYAWWVRMLRRVYQRDLYIHLYSTWASCLRISLARERRKRLILQLFSSHWDVTLVTYSCAHRTTGMYIYKQVNVIHLCCDKHSKCDCVCVCVSPSVGSYSQMNRLVKNRTTRAAQKHTEKVMLRMNLRPRTYWTHPHKLYRHRLDSGQLKDLSTQTSNDSTHTFIKDADGVNYNNVLVPR